MEPKAAAKKFYPCPFGNPFPILFYLVSFSLPLLLTFPCLLPFSISLLDVMDLLNATSTCISPSSEC